MSPAEIQTWPFTVHSCCLNSARRLDTDGDVRYHPDSPKRQQG